MRHVKGILRGAGINGALLAAILLIITSILLTAFSLRTGAISEASARTGAPVPVPDSGAIARILAAGGTFHIADARQERQPILTAHLSLLETPLDAVLIADQSWREVSRDLTWPASVFNAWMDRPSAEDVSDLIDRLLAGTPPAMLAIALTPSMLSTAPPRDGRERGQLLIAWSDAGGSVSAFHPTLDTLLPDGSVAPPLIARQAVRPARVQWSGAVAPQAIHTLIHAIARAEQAGVAVRLLPQIDTNLALAKAPGREVESMVAMIRRLSGGTSLLALKPGHPGRLLCDHAPTRCRSEALGRLLTAAAVDQRAN